MKYVVPRPFADPAVAALKLLEIANAAEAVEDGRIHIEKLNGPFLFKGGGAPGRIRCRAGLCHPARLAVEARERHLREVHPNGRGAVRVDREEAANC
jgi:hypothetical protein